MLAKSVVSVLAVSLLTSVSAFENASAQSTDWQDHAGKMRTRIIAAPTNTYGGAGTLYAWEAELEPGWKTYWRSPGEAGLPVVLKTDDGAPVDLLYPVPERFELFDIETFGYAKKLLIPFVQDDQGAGFSLAGEFMICKDICIPFAASYSVPADLSADAGIAEDVKISRWLAKVPVRGEEADTGLAVRTVTVHGPVGHQRLVVDLEADMSLDGVDILVESGPGVMFSEPRTKLIGSGTAARVVIEAQTGRAPVDIAAQDIRLTVIAQNGTAIDRIIPPAAG